MDALVTKASLNTTALSAAIDRAEKLDRDSYVDTTDVGGSGSESKRREKSTERQEQPWPISMRRPKR